MTDDIAFDPTLDVRLDSGNVDPDRKSKQLRRAHLRLWGTPLPSEAPFELYDPGPRGYLVLRSAFGEFAMTSDSIIHTYRRAKMKPLLDIFPSSDLEEFVTIAHMIGGYIIFPTGGTPTINQARGTNRKIDDRFDLTLECIRRQYVGGDSPLADVLSRYYSFFRIFGDFRGYVNHFLLQDLVSDDYSSVKFFIGFDDFLRPPLPTSVEEYASYSRRAIAFVHARNLRMANRIAEQGVRSSTAPPAGSGA